MRYALGAAKECPAIRRCVDREWADGFAIRRPDGHIINIECLPATRGGSALRGRSLVFAALDEACFFRDADYTVNDEELFRAVAPRIVPGGQVVIASTPWAESGLLYDLFTANHEAPRTAIAAHAPTLLLRDDRQTRGVVERERERDPVNAKREFDAEFFVSGTGVFFDHGAIAKAIDREAPIALPPKRGAVVAAGCDFGLALGPPYGARISMDTHPRTLLVSSLFATSLRLVRFCSDCTPDEL